MRSTPPGHAIDVEPTRLARGTALAAATLTIMAAAIIAPSLPAMRDAFAGTPGADMLVRVAVTVTSLAIAVSAPLSGMVADRVGRRPLLVTGLVLYAASGTAGFFVNDLVPLIFTRALLGVAVGSIMTTVSAIITDWYDGQRRASFLGMQQAFASLGGVVFLPLAGVLATVSWRAPFWLYAAGAVVALLAIFGLDEEPGGNAETITGHQPGCQNPGLRAVGICLLAFVTTLVFYMAPTQLPFLLAALGAGPALIGAVIAGSTVTSTVGALAFSRLRERLSASAITATSAALIGVGWLLIGTAGSVIEVAAGLLVGGLGVGVVVPNLNLRLSELARPDQRGRILSGLVTGIFLGQFASPLVVAPLIETTDIARAFLWTGIATAAGAAIAAIGSSTRKAVER